MALDLESQQRVLVVDDEEAIRVALERGLRRLGFEVLLAADGAAALPIALQQQPEVILLDLRMPGIDGHTFLRRLSEARCDSAVIVISGLGAMEDVVDVLRAGAVDYLKKPWSQSDLIAAVSRGAEVFEKRRELRQLHEGNVPAPASVTSGPARTAPAAPASPPPEAARPKDPLEMIVAKLRSGETPLPAVPTVISELRAMVRQPDTDAEQVAAKIEQDQRIAADVIRLSNTAQYARHGRNTSVKTALMRIGFRQVHALVETAFLQNFFTVKDPQMRARLSQVWSRSVAQGMGMRALASLLAVHDRMHPDTAYLAGLMGDIGASLLLWVVAERAETSGEGNASAESAIDLIRAHHADLGGRLLGQWGFDPLLIQLVGSHHADKPPPSLNLPWCIGIVASQIAGEVVEVADLTAPGAPDLPLIEQCKSDLRLSRQTLARIRDEVRQEHLALLQTNG